MKTLIAYGTTYGCTETCAQKLKEYLGEGVTLLRLGKQTVDIADYDQVILGGSIIGGKVQSSVTAFCAKNKEELKKMRLALFLCSGEEKNVGSYMESAFGFDLLQHAIAKEYFGYAYSLETMGFFPRLILRLVAKVKKSEVKIKEENIRSLAKALVKGVQE